ncbi:methyl-accepting chemotaxis protein [Petroclostridium sp. X23]|nr:methyl-accepting chemotaxis protein [Petroclostridium sp. X23]WHH61625.1 methyl-accepting chemotaxis protein [Petroclostridium sp. X23]
MLASSITKPINNFLEISKDLEKGQGDLTRRINVKSKDELAKMAQSFNKFMDSMENIVLYIKKNSSIVLQGSEQLNEGSVKTAGGISMINTHMGRVAKDTQKISTSINNIAANISEIAQASQASASDAREASLEAYNINKLAQASGKLSLTAAMQEVAASISIQTDIIEGLSTTASVLNESAEQLNGLVSELRLQENQ